MILSQSNLLLQCSYRSFMPLICRSLGEQSKLQLINAGRALAPLGTEVERALFVALILIARILRLSWQGRLSGQTENACSWEGVTNYLTAKSVESVLDFETARTQSAR
jgi:hypothetical protein